MFCKLGPQYSKKIHWIKDAIYCIHKNTEEDRVFNWFQTVSFFLLQNNKRYWILIISHCSGCIITPIEQFLIGPKAKSIFAISPERLLTTLLANTVNSESLP